MNTYSSTAAGPPQRAIADYLDRETARASMPWIVAKWRMVEVLEERFDAAVFHAVTGGGR